MITQEIKQKIAEAIRERASMYPSSAKYATKLGINKSVLSRILNGETEKVLDNARWVTIARLLDVNIGGQSNWVVAETPVYIYVTEQLAQSMTAEIARYQNDMLPAVILIPGKGGALGLADRALHAAVERAVGADIS